MLHLIRLNAIDKLLREVQVISSIWVHRVLNRNTDVSVVSVLKPIYAVLIVGEHNFGPVLSYSVNDLAKKHTIRLKLAVRMIQHHNIANTYRIGCSSLLRRTYTHNPL
jgi:hypothetical protein